MTGTPASLEFSSPAWEARFTSAGLGSLEALWNLEADEVEPGNVRRGGWSAVVRFTLDDGGAFYLKRQQGHGYRRTRPPFERRPTVAREWDAVRQLAGADIGVAEPVCLGVAGERGLLVSVALDDWTPLPEMLQNLLALNDRRQQLIQSLALEVRRIHGLGLRHNCLYGHHILVREEASAGAGQGNDGTAGSFSFSFIDLEKATATRRWARAAIADLSALERHTDDLSHRDRQWFWDSYFRTEPLEQRRRILKVLTRRTADRGVDQYIRDCRSGRRGEDAKGPA